MRALTTDELIYLIQYDHNKKQLDKSKTTNDPTLITDLRKHHTNGMSGYINSKKATEYLKTYTKNMVELNNKLNKLYLSENETNTKRLEARAVSGPNSDEEVHKSEIATTIRMGQNEVIQQINALEKEKKDYFISENNESLKELTRFYYLPKLHGGKRGRAHKRCSSKTRKSKKSRHLTRHRR